MATLGTRIYTALKGRLVGEDGYGNRYFEARRDVNDEGMKKRWVIYKGVSEPSKVPPEWHGWLHYTQALPPTQKSAAYPAWVKEPQPNLTGTVLAYVPPGHVNRGGKRSPSVGDYQPWKP